MHRAISPTDRAIIRLLQQNARISYAELSRETGIPESTVRRRMDRLQQRGVIEFAMLAEPANLGFALRAQIGLQVALDQLDAVAAALAEMPEVTFAALVTGQHDLVIQVVFRSQDALVEFVTQRLGALDGITSTETAIMPRIIKPSTAWVLPLDDTLDAEPLADDDDGADLEEPGETVRRRSQRRRSAA